MNNFKSFFPFLAVGLVIALFLSVLGNKSIPSTYSSDTKPLLIDSTLKYLRYSVELSQALSDRFNNPLLEDFAREIGSNNQKHTRTLVKQIINNNWQAYYQLPKNMKAQLRKVQILADQEAVDFYLTEMQSQIENLDHLYQQEWNIDSSTLTKVRLIQEIHDQQIKFGKDIEDIIQIKMHASIIQ